MKERNSTVVVPPGAIPKTAKFLLGGTAGLVLASLTNKHDVQSTVKNN